MKPVLLLSLVPALLSAAPALTQDDVAIRFAETCGACHMPDASGVPGLAPTLLDASLWDRLGEDAPDYVAGVLLSGMAGTIEAGGQIYSGLVMPPQTQLLDEEIAAMATYLLTTLNDTGLEVTPQAVSALRMNPPRHADLKVRREGRK